AGKRAGQDEGFAGKWTGGGAWLIKLGLEIHSCVPEAFGQIFVPAVSVPLDDAPRNDLADVFTLHQLFRVAGEHFVQRWKCASECFGHTCANMQDSQSKKDPPQLAL